MVKVVSLRRDGGGDDNNNDKATDTAHPPTTERQDAHDAGRTDASCEDIVVDAHFVARRLAHPVTPTVASRVTAEIVKYLMHARGQIACPFAMLDRTSKVTPAIGELCNALSPSLFAAANPTIYLVFGQTPTSAVEAYAVRFPHVVAANDEVPEKHVAQCARQALRALVEHENALAQASGGSSETSLSVTSLHVMLYTAAFNGGAAPDGFLPKRGYRVSRVKTLQIELTHGELGVGAKADEAVNEHAMWFAYRTAVRGDVS